MTIKHIFDHVVQTNSSYHNGRETVYPVEVYEEDQEIGDAPVLSDDHYTEEAAIEMGVDFAVRKVCKGVTEGDLCLLLHFRDGQYSVELLSGEGDDVEEVFSYDVVDKAEAESIAVIVGSVLSCDIERMFDYEVSK